MQIFLLFRSLVFFSSPMYETFRTESKIK